MDNSSQSSGLDQLRKAVIQQKMASIPDEIDDPIFQSLHKIVRQYDQYVSQMVIAVLTGGDKATSYPHKTLVVTAVEEAETSATPKQQRKVDQYRNYISRLDHMHDLALQVSAGSNRNE
jgi:hypothetical protein